MRIGARLKTWLRLNPQRKRSRTSAVILGLMHTASLTALFLALITAVVSRQIIPFYGWIQGTGLERVGLYFVGVATRQHLLWRRSVAGAPLLKEEAEARDMFVQEVERVRPTNVVVLQDNTVLFGRLAATETGESEITYEDDAGPQVRTLAEADVKWTKRIVHAPVQLMPQDVRFLLNFPDYKYYCIPPYLFVADVPYDRIHDANEVLSVLSGEFLRTFGPLVSWKNRSRLVYVCFFRDEETYLKHAIEKEDVDLECSVGFYSQTDECLFVYDRMHSFARDKLDRHIEELAAAAARQGMIAGDDHVRTFTEAAKARSYILLRKQAEDTLRHEGAHQLAHSLGIHSVEGYEHLWLEEGLAQYCETDPMGALSAHKLSVIYGALQSRQYIPWQQLVDTPTPRGFTEYGDRTGLAYSQAWLIFYYCMQKPYRSRFLKYVKWARTMPVRDFRLRRSDVIQERLAVPFPKLARDLNDFARSSWEEIVAGSVLAQDRRSTSVKSLSK